MKIGILTLPLRGNYGGVIQAYALQTFLKKNGIDAYLVDRIWDRAKNEGLLHKIQRIVFHKLIWRRVIEFSYKTIQPRTNLVSSQDDMRVLGNMDFDAFVVGSDQVWRVEFTGGVKNNYFLDFVAKDDVKRVAYAASFGTGEWAGSKEHTRQIKALLQRFKAVSVREKSGVALCQDLFGVSAEHVLDPTLLLDANDYQSLITAEYKNKLKSTLITYVLDKNPKERTLINEIAKTKGLRIKSINVKKDPNGLRNRIPIDFYNYIYPSMYQWLRGFRDAEFIITDSFHGTVFSIIFQKQFIVLGNEHRGLARFLSLLDALGLSDRLVTTQNRDQIIKIVNKRIVYSEVDKLLEIERGKSKRFLIEALNN